MSIFSDLKVYVRKSNVTKDGKPTNVRGVGRVLVHGDVELSFTVMEGKNGIFPRFPSHQSEVKDRETGKPVNRWFDDVRILKDENKTAFQKMVQEAYAAAQNGNNNTKTATQVVSGEENQTQATEDGIPF
jgi:DNA-binding cell septation regulator SpoVG